jgi:hypothetical protein
MDCKPSDLGANLGEFREFREFRHFTDNKRVALEKFELEFVDFQGFDAGLES